MTPDIEKYFRYQPLIKAMALFRRRTPAPVPRMSRPNPTMQDRATALRGDVLDMLAEMIKEPCVNQYVRERAPDLDGNMPPAPFPAPDTGSPECQMLLAEFAVLEELDWALRSIADADATEIIQAYKNRHDSGTPAWASDWGFTEAFGRGGTFH